MLPQHIQADDFESLKTVSGKVLSYKDEDPRLVLALAQRYEIPEIIARILIKRGITLDNAHLFLNPTLKQLLPNPFDLKDMDKGVDIFINALKNHKKIAIFADYDVDGATSSALLRSYCHMLGITPILYIPDRIEEGYGPNSEAMHTLKSQGVELIVMVDCGTLAFEPLKTAQALEMDVVVLDHHLSDVTLPFAKAIINPNRFDENLKHPYLADLCAAGVCFLFLVALQKRLREQGFFETTSEPDLRNFLDLVALGTVCDVMPLLNLNRVFVSHGLRLIERRYNLGIRSIMDVAGCYQKPSSYHLGFVIGPRINAGGRVGKAWLGSELLTTKDDILSKDYAKQLDVFNQERQLLEKQILTEAEEEINSKNLHKKPLILVSGEKWHPGVIGIVASRIKERYSKPALVVSFLQGIGKGSGRSVSGASLGHAMHQALHHGLLVHGGGHAMAAGFSVEEEKYNDFYSFLCDHFEPFLKEYQPTLTIDGIIHLSGVTLDLLKTLEKLEPFGQGNPTPRFMIKDISIVAVEGFGQDHIRCLLMSPNGTRIKGVAFRAKGTLLGDVLFSNKKNIHCIGTLKLNTWGGNEEINIMIDDIVF